MHRKALKNFQGVRYVESENGDRCFYIRYRDLNNKQIEEKIGWASEGITPQQAQLIRNERIKAIRLGDEVVTIQSRRKTSLAFGDFFEDRYITNALVNKKKITVETEMFVYKKWIKPIIGNKALKNITPFDLERIKKTMKDAGKSPRTIKYAVSIVRQTFNKATEWGLYDNINPASKVKTPKENNKRSRFLTHTEAKELLLSLKTRSKQFYEISLLSLFTGMRAGEIFNLKFGDIDLDNGIIHIKSPKNGEDRVAYITPEIKEILAPKKGKSNEYVFKDKNGNKIKEVSNAYDRAVKRLGLNNGIEDRKDKVVFHTLRHTFASWLVMKGTPLYTVSKLMGHKSITMTERYSHLSPDTKRQATEKLTGILDDNVVELKIK